MYNSEKKKKIEHLTKERTKYSNILLPKLTLSLTSIRTAILTSTSCILSPSLGTPSITKISSR